MNFKKVFLSIKPLSIDLGLLLIRLSSGLLMLNYGFQKLSNFNTWKKDFPDPLGMGHELSLALCIFAEFFCSILIALGLFTRLALVPLIINVLVIVLIVHAADPFSEKEHGLSFLFPYLLIFLAGPGRFSVDSIIWRK